MVIKVAIYGKIFTITNLYLPNYDQIRTGIRALYSTMEKAEGTVIIGGDFNFVMDIKIDTTNTHAYRNKSQIEEFKRGY